MLGLGETKLDRGVERECLQHRPLHDFEHGLFAGELCLGLCLDVVRRDLVSLVELRGKLDHNRVVLAQLLENGVVELVRAFLILYPEMRVHTSVVAAGLQERGHDVEHRSLEVGVPVTFFPLFPSLIRPETGVRPEVRNTREELDVADETDELGREHPGHPLHILDDPTRNRHVLHHVTDDLGKVRLLLLERGDERLYVSVVLLFRVLAAVVTAQTLQTVARGNALALLPPVAAAGHPQPARLGISKLRLGPLALFERKRRVKFALLARLKRILPVLNLVILIIRIGHKNLLRFQVLVHHGLSHAIGILRH